MDEKTKVWAQARFGPISDELLEEAVAQYEEACDAIETW